MVDTFLKFINMGGYGWYVWTSYSIVILYLFVQWLIPWRRWAKFKYDNTKQIS